MINREKVYKVVSDVLGVAVKDINDETSPDNVEQWDSLSHINLVIAIEAEFAVSLTPEDTIDMLSVKLIRMILEDKINNK